MGRLGCHEMDRAYGFKDVLYFEQQSFESFETVWSVET
jgi:hypothetical protein